MPKLANPVPPVQVYARATGKFYFTCPNCGQEYPFRPIPWRRADPSCTRCHAHFRIGLGFSTERKHESYIMGKWDGYNGNRLNPIGTGFDGAKVSGAVEWACPECSTAQDGFLSHDLKLECSSCGKPYFISLLIYRSAKGLKIRAPFDSLIKGLIDVRETAVQPLPSAEIPQTAGTPDDSFGDNS